MNILIIGANGTTGRKMVELIGKQGQHQAIAVVREENQINDLIALGASEVRLGDLTKEVTDVVKDADVVIFAAGAGGASEELTRAVDKDGAIKVIDAAKASGIKRFLMLSSVGADHPQGDLKVYLESKGAADRHLKDSGLDYTIVRPGPLSYDAPTGTIETKEHFDSYEGREVPRDDVAALFVTLIDHPTQTHQFEVLSGPYPIAEALRNQ
ncbi:SDR family oxidoreductase [Exiguobacterium antarcticum]|uniref:SDR family oxidoreductase n=1 Tax=Exiguobacterium antarcticum TaxID=132920 RepID=A0ABT6QXL3_9BACL|nr:SDR family oxidoreductase [Exiguobacterium antarcticum]AFS71219.1 NAD-dependent epimerase/dehydratase [Exiguobacterium antarcticum B7]MDI3233431.1 SDR family oxidoreductase [Exiguobacterium antarcticum]